MRRSLALALLALLLSVPLASSAPRLPAAAHGQPFAAAPTATFGVEVAEDSTLRITLKMLAGKAHALSVDGPGRCAHAPFQEVRPGSTASFDCGAVPAGRHVLTVYADQGSAVGRWRAYSANVVFA